MEVKDDSPEVSPWKLVIQFLLATTIGVFGILTFSGKLYQNDEIPPLGLSSEELKAMWGPASVIDKAGMKSALPNGPWSDPYNKNATVDAGQLPPVSNERWFYSRGLLGTSFILIYIEANRVTKIYTSST